MSRADELRAELAVAELEEQLVAAKDAGDVPAELKRELRAARQAHREMREAAAAELEDGDAVASPATIAVTAEVQEG